MNSYEYEGNDRLYSGRYIGLTSQSSLQETIDSQVQQRSDLENYDAELEARDHIGMNVVLTLLAFLSTSWLPRFAPPTETNMFETFFATTLLVNILLDVCFGKVHRMIILKMLLGIFAVYLEEINKSYADNWIPPISVFSAFLFISLSELKKPENVGKILELAKYVILQLGLFYALNNGIPAFAYPLITCAVATFVFANIAMAIEYFYVNKNTNVIDASTSQPTQSAV